MSLNNVLAPGQYYGMTQQGMTNANFDLAQRGSSFTNPANATITLDHWKPVVVPDGGVDPTIIHSQQILALGDINYSYFYYRINTSGAGSGYGVNAQYAIENRIEHGTRNLAGLGKKVTKAFWARSSIAGKKLGIFLSQAYGTGGSPTAAESINGTNWTLTSTWTKYTYTFITNTLVGKTFGTNNDDFLLIRFYTMWGSSIAPRVGAGAVAETFVGAGNIEISQVKPSAGDVDVPFQPKSPNEILIDCQRYAIAYTDVNINFSIGVGSAISTTQVKIQVDLPQTMRIQPTLSATAGDWQLTDGVTATDLTAIAIVVAESSNKSVTLLCTVASGLTQFRTYRLTADGTANRLMLFDAEL